MTSMMNIGGDAKDTSFRYKMPTLQIKSEGRGNGLKTVLLNLSDVAKALCLPADYLGKFFSLELGCAYRSDVSSRPTLNGAHTVGELTTVLMRFVKEFVLCPRCHLPEWTLSLTKQGVISGRCSACGYHGMVQSKHKMLSYIIKHPPTSATSVTGMKVNPVKEEINTQTKKHQEEKEEEDAEEDEMWAEDTSKEAQLARFQEEMEDRNITRNTSSRDHADSLPERLRRSLHDPAKTPLQIMAELRQMELAHHLTPMERIRILLEAMLSSPKWSLTPHKGVLVALFKDKYIGPTFMGALEATVGETEEGKWIPRFPILLQELYDMDLLTEEFLLCWHDSPPEASFTISKKLSVTLRETALPFIEWLKTAESESDDDE